MRAVKEENPWLKADAIESAANTIRLKVFMDFLSNVRIGSTGRATTPKKRLQSGLFDEAHPWLHSDDVGSSPPGIGKIITRNLMRVNTI
jgi:hypothetical protein